MVVFAEYDVMVQVVMFFMAVFMLLLIKMTKPENTRLMKLNKVGFYFSIATIVVQMVMTYETSNAGTFNKSVFNITYIFFCICYGAVMVIVFSYTSQLSYRERINKKKNLIKSNVLFYLSLLIDLYPMVTDKLLKYNEEGGVEFTIWAGAYLVSGVISTAWTIINTIVNKRSISRIVYVGTLTVAPLVVVALLAQFPFNKLMLSSVSYVLPLVLCYMLFHSPRYDETAGSQNDESIHHILQKAATKHKKYLVLYISFPQLEKLEFHDIKKEIEYAKAIVCREIEQVKFSLRTYSRSNHAYMAFCYVKNAEEADIIAKKIVRILDRPVEVNGLRLAPCVKAVGVTNNEFLDSAKKVNSLIGYMIRNYIADNDQSEYIYADDAIINKFTEYELIERELYDIRRRANLDDERIICLAQPINEVASGKFKTAEALMRMKINGKTYFPDQFIPIAEHNDCIHILTLIILNKVCKQIKELEKEYAFDAITVNCSTMDLENGVYTDEIYKVIEDNAVSPEKIRLEITESVGEKDYEGVMLNINKLHRKGIRFYLDDFGTGYSNVSRISNFPLKTVKVDKSMLYKALEDENTALLLEILVKYFAGMGIETLVEGVEDESQKNFSEKIGMKYIQGYLYSKPLEIERMREFFSKK